MLDPASPIYELLIGSFFLVIAVSSMISIPTMYALYVSSEEDAERINKQ